MTADQSHFPSRRTWLTGGTFGLIMSLSPGERVKSSAAEPASAAPLRWVTEFGAKGDGTDDTEALRSAMAWAGEAAVPRAVVFPAGIYAVDELRVPAQVRLIGAGGGLSRYPRAGAFGGVTIVPTVASASSAPLVTLAGPVTPGGAVLEGIVIDGRNFRTPGAPMDRSTWSQRTGLAVEGGFEARLCDVRVIRFRGIGIDVLALNNTKWDSVYVDLCGTPGLPAMRIGSSAGATTNFVVFDGLTIERSGNTALAIGAGTDLALDWASNVTFIGLHVESTRDTAGVELNTGALIDVGNVRAVSFIAPQIVGAPSPIIRYEQRVPADAVVSEAPGGDTRDQQGGVSIVGGILQQHTGTTSRIAAVRVAGGGRGFAATGVRFASGVAPGVLIESSFRYDAVVLGCSFRMHSGVPQIIDSRTDEAALRFWATRSAGSFAIDRDLDVARDVRIGRDLELGRAVRAPGGRAGVTAPTLVAPEPSNGSVGWAEMSSRGPGSDLLGEIWWRLTRKASRSLVRLQFARAKTAAPAVFIVPRKPSTAKLSLYVELERSGDLYTGFVLKSADVCAPGPDTHIVEYGVVDRG